VPKGALCLQLSGGASLTRSKGGFHLNQGLVAIDHWLVEPATFAWARGADIAARWTSQPTATGKRAVREGANPGGAT